MKKKKTRRFFSEADEAAVEIVLEFIPYLFRLLFRAFRQLFD